MKVVEVRSVKAAILRIQSSAGRLDKRMETALRRSARGTELHVKKNMPVAFSELRDSVHVENFKVVADAPHAAGVERGTRPHKVPLAAMVRWVSLRAMQGVIALGQGGSGRVKRLPGTTTARHAKEIGAQTVKDGEVDEQAVTAIAMAIVKKIALHGTKPHWYMRSAIPYALTLLKGNVARALREHAA